MKFIAMIVGGVGPDVWDRDVEIDGADFADAANLAQGKAEEMGGRVLTMEEPYSAEEVCRQRVATELDVQELRDVKEYLWPNQTGLPNEHRSALIAIQARENLLRKQIATLESERAEQWRNSRELESKLLVSSAALSEFRDKAQESEQKGTI